MDIQQRLWAFQMRELIDDHIVDTVLNVRQHFATTLAGRCGNRAGKNDVGAYCQRIRAD